MTNLISSHPTTRAQVLDRCRGVRRYARRLRDKLRDADGFEAGTLTNQRRHEWYMQAEGLVKATENLIRLLDDARVKPSRSSPRRITRRT